MLSPVLFRFQWHFSLKLQVGWIAISKIWISCSKNFKASLHFKEHLNSPFYSVRQNSTIWFSTRSGRLYGKLQISCAVLHLSPPSNYDLTYFILPISPQTIFAFSFISNSFPVRRIAAIFLVQFSCKLLFNQQSKPSINFHPSQVCWLRAAFLH